ncbi:MAG: aryl-sulfate sulfotransferase [Candidatus Thermoplasmatota archaeon]|nr:aryl-sulfate sulfotransferase [Candidatus Thermoplasmatota archaeon]
MVLLSIIFLLIGSCSVPISLPRNAELAYQENSMILDGQILFSPMWSTTTYLVDNSGVVNNTWSSSFFPGVAVWWLGDGTILRTIRVGVGPGTGGAGGGVQIVEWDGSVVWDYRYNTGGYMTHHDVKSLPNGNVLLIAWETKSRSDAIAAGRNPSYVSNNGMMPDHIIEVQPTGPTSGSIVWEWHVWDHLIQDYDPSKTNYGVVANHPELVNINYVTSTNSDWMHTNSVDYHEEFDQILISIHNFNEIWVIDHSTTTAEASGHTGGNSGKGGDLLYRWGNPLAYQAGTINDRKLFSQHDASWIKPGYPGEGNILVFNNGANRPGSHYSTIDEITPPVNNNGEYYLQSGTAYGPAVQTWIYTANPPTSFYASHISGAQRLIDGNTIICNGETGKIFEVTPEGATVWQYTNPYPTPSTNDIFKIVYIPPGEPPQPNIPNLDCSGSLSWTNIKPHETVNGSFQLQNIGNTSSLLNWRINISSITWGAWSFTPESGDNLTPEDGQISVQVFMIAPNQENTEFEGYIRVENKDNPDDFDLIPVYLKTPVDIPIGKNMFYQFILKIKSFCLEHIWNLFDYILGLHHYQKVT